MISEKLQKSRAFIEAECVKTAGAQNLCRELKHVRIRRLFPSGTAANWEPAEFEPPLSPVGECMAQKAISSLPDTYALAAGNSDRTSRYEYLIWAPLTRSFLFVRFRRAETHVWF